MNQHSSWKQKTVMISARSRGYHIITNEILEAVPEVREFKTGLMHLFIRHTSASLTINENADPSVRRDFTSHFKRMVPEDTTLYEHTQEGPDDMTSHIKSSILGHSVTVPVTDGTMNLGRWQGIYLCEHRSNAGDRSIVVTLMGDRI